MYSEVGRNRTCCGLDSPGIESNSPHLSRPVLWATRPLIVGTGSSPGIRRPRRGVNHPFHLAPRLKKEYSYTSTPLWTFVPSSRVNFTFRYINIYVKQCSYKK